MKRNRIIIVATIALLAVLYITLFNMKPASYELPDLIPFDKEGFVDSNELGSMRNLVAENDNFELYINELTSYIEVVDKATGEKWLSNPQVLDPWIFDSDHLITNSAIQKQKATLELAYFNEAGSKTSVNNYRFSIFHDKTITEPAGKRTYSIKYVPNGVQVLYYVEDLEIDYLYFPKYIPKDVFEAMPEKDDIELAYTGFSKEHNAYEINLYEDMSILVKEKLYEVFYDKLGYTRERSIEENSLYGYDVKFEKIFFEVAIEVTLNENGIETSIIKDSIVEPDNVKLSNITLYPLFGTAISKVGNTPTEGYIVLPDGSGAVMEFNNGKFYQEPYVKRFYGIDTALMSYKMPEEQEKISIPLFGMVKEDSAFAAIVTEGDAMATLNADVSGRIDSYNKAYISFSMREVESITLGSGYQQYGIDLWTEDIVDTDFSVSYSFLNGDKANYVGIAEVYRNYLMETNELMNHDDTDKTVVTAELIGAYDNREFFLGVPYNTVNSLTSFDEAAIIAKELINRDVTNLNILYTGMINGGIKSELNDEFDLEKSLGSKRDYNNLLDELSDNNVSLYPKVRLTRTADFDKIFDSFRYTSSRIDGDLARYFKYHLPSKLPYSETQYLSSSDDYVINPLFLQEIYDDFSKDYDQDHIAFDSLGSLIGGHYEDDTLYKQDSKRIYESLLMNINETTMLSNPLGFAIPYSDYVVDMPTETTLYAILDYQIPLIHLVLSGMVDYATESINMINERSLEYSFLKVLETGSNLKYTLSYDDSKELRNTEYNYYISTHYENWMDLIEDSVSEIDALGIHEGYLVGHERLRENVYKVTYSHGLEIVINYNLSSIPYGPIAIGPMEYYVVEVD